MFFGFKIDELRRVKSIKNKCAVCEESILRGIYHVVHQFYATKTIEDLIDIYQESLVKAFEDAILSLLDDKKDNMFFLHINGVNFPVMVLVELRDHLLEQLKSEEKFDFSDPEFFIRIHLL